MVVGIDSHKVTVAACAVDELGAELATAIFPNTNAGHHAVGGQKSIRIRATRLR